ncbi:MAG: hypothetical protein JNM78_14470 [Cyclobacteriaceae bacterium]|nr:hypothetical protein [Cyclobacteriaceae bacterium]
MLRFLISLSISTVLLLFILYAGNFFEWWFIPSFWKEIVFFLFFITLIITNYLFKVRQKQPQVFVLFYLLSISLKMIAGLGFVFFLIWETPTEVRANVSLFILSYLLFTGLEVIFLMTDANSKKGP